MDTKVKEFVSFQIERRLSSLSKNFLVILEDLRDKRYNLDEETYSRLRKHTLDNFGDANREILSILEKIDVILK